MKGMGGVVIGAMTAFKGASAAKNIKKMPKMTAEAGNVAAVASGAGNAVNNAGNAANNAANAANNAANASGNVANAAAQGRNTLISGGVTPTMPDLDESALGSRDLNSGGTQEIEPQTPTNSEGATPSNDANESRLKRFIGSKGDFKNGFAGAAKYFGGMETSVGTKRKNRSWKSFKRICLGTINIWRWLKKCS